MAMRLRLRARSTPPRRGRPASGQGLSGRRFAYTYMHSSPITL